MGAGTSKLAAFSPGLSGVAKASNQRPESKYRN